MNIVIVGKGAIGMLWFSAFTRLNNNLLDENTKITVRFKTRQPEPNGTLQFSDINHINHKLHFSIADNSHLTNADLIVYTVKAYQLYDAINETLPYLNNQATVIFCHNGMGTLTELDNLLPDELAILAMLTTHGCLKKSATQIIHTGLGHTNIGLIKGDLSQQRKKQVVDLLSRALPTLMWQENIIEKQWQKLAINCVINPLTALYNIKNGEVNKEQFVQQIEGLCLEIAAVAKTQHINLVVNELINNVQTVAHNTANNHSSMLCDLLSKKRTEIDYINGYIERLGQQHHIATPENSRLYLAIKKREAIF